MKPFRISEPLSTLREARPTASRLLEVARAGNRSSHVTLAQLWLTEGIPVAFSDCPALYDVVRLWLSTRLEIHAKEISLVGSARIGQSLNPQTAGKSFDHTSDLDLLAVSPRLFHSFRSDFMQWAADFHSGHVQPANPTEEGHWVDNKRRGSDILRRGFMDSWMIPSRPSYTVAQRTANWMWHLVKKLARTDSAPKPKKATLRVYRSWESAVEQISLNLKHASRTSRTGARGLGPPLATLRDHLDRPDRRPPSPG